jgi:hypothetical protein
MFLQIVNFENLTYWKDPVVKGHNPYRITHIFPGLEDRNLVPNILDTAKTMKFL